ncbi:uncharacterized protein BXZ73DRAFT_90459 [Epithele typhae]|uniref:uncharacterized protein n=1 Tax=Epithele typhae TaxID=378194 RepID=UPI002008E801|nr:uncharacterized protein BXZ73DRAFT_90459 [Epithele typhae]KAH9929620.1 hypothetical protein BXZ73DRAFT_90459 [Epithele typhae]
MTELTTSRINRKLRTLRSKCAALNGAQPTSSKPKVSTTYGRSNRTSTRASNEEEESPPLAILQSLDKISARFRYERATVENMQLSKRIYEVRDAFKNIVQLSASSHTKSQPDPDVSSYLSSLTGICAQLIGEHIQGEVEASIDDLSEVKASQEDELRSQIMDDVYESIPAQHRHHTLVAHALTYILETCPHYPTLLNALLETCLEYGSGAESQTILSKLFAVAIHSRTRSMYPCPLTHPAHKHFLVTLRGTCNPAPGSSTPINNRAFVRLLVDALSEPYPERLLAWTSKATAHLARDVKQDFHGCFVPLCTGLAHALAAVPKSSRNTNRAIEHAHVQVWEDAHSRLVDWTTSMLSALYSATCSGGPDVDMYTACVDFLVAIEPDRLHICSDSVPTPLAKALCCLAVYCIANPPAPSPPGVETDLLVLEKMLRTATIKNATFNSLTAFILPLPHLSSGIYRDTIPEPFEGADIPTPLPQQTGSGERGAPAIEALVEPLRARGLVLCEAALYLAALQHLSNKELYDLRLYLMDRVEDSERRCFSGSVDGVPPPLPEGGSQWRFDDSMGAWTVKTPEVSQAKKAENRRIAQAAKRRKLDDGKSASAATSPHIPTQAPRRQSDADRRPIPSWDNRENFSDDGGSDNEPSTPAPKRLLGTSSFQNLLANARLNTISLRAEREANTQKIVAKPKGRVSAPARLPDFVVPESPASASVGALSSPMAPRTPSNGFRTALADSHRNVIRLNEERARERGQLQGAGQETCSAITPRGTVKRKNGARLGDSDTEAEVEEPENSMVESSPAHASAYVEPSSDDALNLFAYPDSSPVKRRRHALY